MFSSDELQRYNRQIIIEEWGIKGQEKLANSRVFIAGGGGLASPVAMYLAAAGVGTITICDNDIVDISNLNRQIIHNEKRIGLNKADSAYATLSSINHHVNIHIIKEKIKAGNAATLTGNSDIIIDCLDNFPSRHDLNKASVKLSIPLIHGGVSGFSGQVSLLVPPETACLSCFLPSKTDRKKIPIYGATVGVIGSLQATEAIKFILGIPTPLKGKILFWDGMAMKFDSFKLKKKAGCKVCGKK